MAINLDKSPIIEMTEKLCAAILEQPEYKEINEKITTFSHDTHAKTLYQSLYEHQMRLQQKQEQGLPITEEETHAFQTEYESLLENEAAKGFLEAQQMIEEIEQTINSYITNTIKLGRVPRPEDFLQHQGGCACGGGSCGCGGH
ncbi:YlbF family regulator [Pueribacillus sp. YX66]|uniref:YlbF family regulator n=1 Tax=Pueribacillus sp. YX66 TaxID=3229242 RepID=UPI00358D8A29